MHAVVRETRYAPDNRIQESPEFREFQKVHADRQGYRGTIVVDLDKGRFVTLTLWETEEDMAAARNALEPVVERLLNPMMTESSKLLGTGRVVVNDLA